MQRPDHYATHRPSNRPARRLPALVFRLPPAAVALTLLAGSPQPARAADWPTRAVSVVVPFAAGGNTDMMARIGAERLTARFGQSFVVENRPSAGGAVAVTQVARAAPDGYTLLFSASANLLLTPLVQKVTYDADRDFVPITNVGTGTQVLAVRRDLPVKTFAELIAYAKANPGKLNYVTAGTQNISHLGPVLLAAHGGLDMVLIPAKGGPQAVADLVSGQVDMYFGNASELLPFRDGDKIRLLAVGTATRLPQAPELPAIAETFPGFAFSSWNGFTAPAGTPPAVVEAIRSEITAAAKTPEIAQRLTSLGIIPGGLSAAEVAAVFKTDRQIFTEAARAAGILLKSD